MKSMIRTGMIVAAGLMLASLACGCSSDRVTAAGVRSNMSPELESVAMTSEQRKNVHARAIDTTMRQIWDDLDTLLLIDRPIRLTRYPLP